MSKKALVVVEEKFLEVHVGVRRVTLYLCSELEKRGIEVTLAYPKNGKLITYVYANSFTELEKNGFTKQLSKPFWHSRVRSRYQLTLTPDRQSSLSNKLVPPTTGAEIRDVEKFDLSIITNPWLKTEGLPTLPNLIGVVLDVIPNLLALGALHFASHVDCYQFANEHAVGFDYYNRNAKEILFISECTMNDYLRMHGAAADRAIQTVLMPFRCPEETAAKAEFHFSDRTRKAILAVNFLDPRKNFTLGMRALQKAAETTPFNLVIVGRERCDFSVVYSNLQKLEAAGVGIVWFRECSDALLETLYRSADVTFFPSIYEGLGLPILESQSFGTPVISTNQSSCREINLLSQLSAAPDDLDGLAKLVSDVVTGRIELPERSALASQLRTFIAGWNSLSRSQVVRSLETKSTSAATAEPILNQLNR